MPMTTTSATRALLLAAAITITAACNKTPSPTETTAADKPVATPAADNKPKALTELALGEVKITRNQTGKLVAQGTVSNTSTRKIDQIEARLKLSDANGKELGTVSPAVASLQPGSSWTFEIEVLQPDAAQAALIEFVGK